MSRRGLAVRLHRGVLRRTLRPAVRWRPIDEPRDGYTVVIGCDTRLPSLLLANLQTLMRQRRENLARIIVVFDRPRRLVTEPIERRVREQFTELPLRFIYYSEGQHRRARFSRWPTVMPGVYSWMSWATGIAAVRTRYAILHDFDCLLIQPDFLEERYRLIREHDVHYLGIQSYRWGAIHEDDQLAQTFELMFDAQFVRQRFEPIDLFNKMRQYKGVVVDLDTFLHAQLTDGRRHVDVVPQEALVHPGQVISQFQRLMHVPGYIPPGKNNLLLLPYFFYLAGDEGPLHHLREQVESTPDGTVMFFGQPMKLTELTAEHVEKITGEAYLLERGLEGRVRPPVRWYFETLRDFAESLRPNPYQAAAALG